MKQFLHEFQTPRLAFWKKFHETLFSIGEVSPKKRPLQYPRHAPHCDLVRIGRDMYKAMGIVVEDIEIQDDRAATAERVNS